MKISDDNQKKITQLKTRVVLAVNAVHKMLHILHEYAVSERRY